MYYVNLFRAVECSPTFFRYLPNFDGRTPCFVYPVTALPPNKGLKPT